MKVTQIQLLLPDEVQAELILPDPDGRDADLVVLSVEGLTVAASVVTLAALRPQFGALAAALRKWVLRRPAGPPPRLTVQGRGLDLRVDLSPNVSRAEIIAALQPLLERDDGSGTGRDT